MKKNMKKLNFVSNDIKQPIKKGVNMGKMDKENEAFVIVALC